MHRTTCLKLKESALCTLNNHDHIVIIRKRFHLYYDFASQFAWNQTNQVISNKFTFFLRSGQNSYNGFDFSGTLFVGTRSDDDFIGLAFSYQNDRNFYLLTWKQRRQGYWRSIPSFLSKARTGIELKVKFTLDKEDSQNGAVFSSTSSAHF